MTSTKDSVDAVPDDSLEENFRELCKIVRAQHFLWRQAVQQLCPGVDPADVVDQMWKLTGQRTAEAFAERIDAAKPLAQQVASGIVRSSRSMGEHATVEPGESDSEAFVRHTECPWQRWHQRMDLAGEDRRGCDCWFQATVDGLSAALGAKVCFETLQTMPDGDPSCLRRIWVEE